jgi:predicted nuclease of restriction endonuclease-like RecB superfamily
LLTTELTRVRKKGEAVVPRYLRKDERARAAALAERYLVIFAAHVGQPRDALEAQKRTVEVSAADRILALGLWKLLEDRCTFQSVSALDPEQVRRAVFLAAARAHQRLELRADFDRAAVLAEVAPALGTDPASLDDALYADLRGSERLESFDPLPVEALLQRYDVALAQGVLLRATKVVVHVSGAGPAVYKGLFRAMRFHGLLHVVRGNAEAGWVIELDGPFSLFDAVQRYGLKLALFLPHLLACPRFELRAEVLWGKAKEPRTFDLSSKDGLAGGALPVTSAPDLSTFIESFAKLGSEWQVRPSDQLFALPGEVVCVPDLVFESEETGEQVFLEVFGFWSREAVWKRVELIRKGFPSRIILAIGKQLRVSEEVLEEGAAGELYVYKSTMSARAVLGRLRRDGAKG